MPAKKEGHYHLAVELTPKQAKDAYEGKGIMVKHSQFGKGHLFVHHENHQKLARAHKAGRAVKIYLGPGELMHTAYHHIEHNLDGSGLWGKIWSGIKKGYNWLKDNGVLTALADKGAQALSGLYPEASPAIGVARNELKKRAGFGIARSHSGVDEEHGTGLYLS